MEEDLRYSHIIHSAHSDDGQLSKIMQSARSDHSASSYSRTDFQSAMEWNNTAKKPEAAVYNEENGNEEGGNARRIDHRVNPANKEIWIICGAYGTNAYSFQPNKT